MQAAMGVEARKRQRPPAPRGGGKEDVEKKQRQQKRRDEAPEHAAASLRVRISVDTLNIVPQDGKNVKRLGLLRVGPPARDIGKGCRRAERRESLQAKDAS